MRSEEFWRWYEQVAPYLWEREPTFRQMFAHLDSFDRPVHIVETGVMDGEATIQTWHDAGNSTYLFDMYAKTHPGSVVRSVDIDPDRVINARAWLTNVDFAYGDSVAFLRSLKINSTPIDLLYLDSFDLDVYNPVPSEHHHLNELMAALPCLEPHSLVVVDDSPAWITYETAHTEVSGKGALVARYALSVGADMVFLRYQVGFTNITKTPDRSDESLKDLVERARWHIENGRPVAANNLYQRILVSTRPPYKTGMQRIARSEACIYFGRMARLAMRYGASVDWFRMALDADPRALEYRLELAIHTYLPMDYANMAELEAERGTLVEPENPLPWRVLGDIRHLRGNATGALEAFDKAVELGPDNTGVLVNRAAFIMDVGWFDEAKEAAEKALNTPLRADALHILAMIAQREARHEEAIELFDKAVSAGTTDPAVARWHKSLSLEAIGRYREAFSEREQRIGSVRDRKLTTSMRRFEPIPLWRGEPAPAIIHVHAEAGSGDNIAMVRYLPILAKRGYTVRYEADDDMIDLLRFSMPDIEIVQKAPDYPGYLGIHSFDYHLPIGSLQYAMGTDIDTVPWEGPYIKAKPELVEKYAKRLAGYKRKIGFVWSSGIRLHEIWLTHYGRSKSMHFTDIVPIIQRQRGDDAFISLQVGPEREQKDDYIHIIGDLLPEKPSWDETAALVANLDLVITVDTAVAHLAAAMGKPVWIMMRRDGASWHFMCWRPGAPWNERSPWYPSVRLFRQHEFNKSYWGDVVAEVSAELDRFRPEGADDVLGGTVSSCAPEQRSTAGHSAHLRA